VDLKLGAVRGGECGRFDKHVARSRSGESERGRYLDGDPEAKVEAIPVHIAFVLEAGRKEVVGGERDMGKLETILQKNADSVSSLKSCQLAERHGYR
jgi:hypothetical protein